MTHFDYSVEDGQLIVRELPAGRLIRRQTFEVPVRQVVAMPTGEGCLVLLDKSATKQFVEHLLRVGADGSIVWKAELPQSHDSFVGILAVADDHVEASTWYGWNVDLDLETGRIKNQRFTK